MLRLAYLAIVLLPGAFSQATSEAVCTVSSLSWTFNSLNDSPCQVAADLAGVCNGGVFTLQPLDPGFVYLGPSKLVQNSCRCSTVYYSMLSACAACQGNEWLEWSQYNGNCTRVYTGSFPQSIPSGTRVPGWAYADVLVTNGFNLTVAQDLENRPESTGAGSSTSSFSFPTSRTSFTFGGTTGLSTGSPTFSPLPNSGRSSSNAGAIAGGVIGGVVGLALIAGLAFFFIRRRREGGQGPASSAFNTTSYTPAPYNPEPTPDMGYNPNAGTPYTPSVQPQRLYDPSDPSTFPTSPAPVPSSPYTNTSYTPPPASNTYPSFQSSTPQVAQPHMPTPAPAPAGHYTGAPEL